MNLGTLTEEEDMGSDTCILERHPFPQIITPPYDPTLGYVTEECSNCGSVNDRDPTPQEISEYKTSQQTEN